MTVCSDIVLFTQHIKVLLQGRLRYNCPMIVHGLTKHILSCVRKQGIRLSAYLDDWLLMAWSEAEATIQATMAQSLH